MPYTKPIFGTTIGWAAEVAPPEVLEGLLKHADTYMNPSWANGGLYYPRCDEKEDGHGNWRFVDPYTGNGAIGYARLNVPDGQKLMWEKAWTPQRVQDAVAVENVSFADGVDFLRSQWCTESANGFTGLVLSMRTWHGRSSKIQPDIVGLPDGRYGVFSDGTLLKTHVQEGSEALRLVIEVGGTETTK
ncbi:hypothetical protein LTR37_008837 [Vermiconidia calcicola]|uniref:Uncharacterized protein n=1 Tax=Vermiconidia calcicola TaxID=1690605 RepID=A0ACC3N9Q0_9PEZI|nr:hypothetical protein LTR37_008837 [Vermiconidia calcicola]